MVGRAPPGRRQDASALLKLPEVGFAVEPELVAAHRFLHRHVVDRLVERDDWHLLHAERDEVLHALVVLGGVFGEAGAIDEPVHRLVLVGGNVEDRIFAVQVPEEKIFGISSQPLKRLSTIGSSFLFKVVRQFAPGIFSMVMRTPIFARLSWMRTAVGSPTVAVPTSSAKLVSRPCANPASCINALARSRSVR